MSAENEKLKYYGPSIKLEPISRSQYQNIYNVCLNTRQKLIVSLLFEGGLTVEELADIHICDLQNMNNGEIRIVSRNDISLTKYDANGAIFVPEYVISLIRNYRDSESGSYCDDGPLIMAYRSQNFGHDHFSELAASRLFQRLSHRCGDSIMPYMLRHGFIQEKLQEGWSEDDMFAYLSRRNMADPDDKQYLRQQNLMQMFFKKYGSSLNPEAVERQCL